MKMQMLGRMLPFPMIAASANAQPAKPSAAAAPCPLPRPAQPARLELRWQRRANGLVCRWVAPQSSEAGEPAAEEGSSLLLAV